MSRKILLFTVLISFIILFSISQAEKITIEEKNSPVENLNNQKLENLKENTNEKKSSPSNDHLNNYIERPLYRYDPWSIFDNFFKSSNSLFDSFWDDHFLPVRKAKNLFSRSLVSPSNDGFVQSFGSLDILSDVKKLDDRYVVEASVPGFDKSELQISVKKSIVQGKTILTIQGDKKSHEENGNKAQDNFIIKERRETFSRSFAFDFNVNEDQVKASYHNGVLTVEVPYTNVSTNSKFISIE